MQKITPIRLATILTITIAIGCTKSDSLSSTTNIPATTVVTEATKVVDPYANIKIAFGTNIDPTSLFNYANQTKPNYILKDNGTTNPITDSKATLGRVLFYDKNLSVDNTITCNSCHRAPEFDIDSNSRNNGIIGTIGTTVLDIANTRSASLRDLINPNGVANTPMMHTGQFKTIQEVLNHYNNISNLRNTNLDPKLRPNNIGQKLNMTSVEITAITAFLKTLSGTAVYTDKRWSDPFIK